MQVPLYYPLHPLDLDRLDRRLVKLYVQQGPLDLSYPLSDVRIHLSHVQQGPQEGEGSVRPVAGLVAVLSDVPKQPHK